MANQPAKITEKYNTMDLLNAIVNRMKAMNIPGADKIPVVVDD